MTNKTKFFITSLLGIMIVTPSVAATPATQDWVKQYTYKKATVEGAMQTLSKRMAYDIRDKIYDYDEDQNSPTYQQVLNPLNTTEQTAFGGINELLTKVDGNDGTNSAVELKTTAKNAFGAINELKQDVDTVYDNGTQKRVNVKIVNDFTSNDFNAIKAAAENND